MCDPSQKHVLLVFAHQDGKSFNGALKDAAVDTLRSLGHSVEVSDLYSQQFEPRATKNDIRGPLQDPNLFNYTEEGRHAYKHNCQSLDIANETDKLKRADLIIFQFPLYWSSVPAILKGWFDRVLCDSFAFDFESQNVLDQGFMKGKRTVLSLTTGCTKDMTSPMGLSSDINVLLWPIQYGTLRMCGFDVLLPQISYGTKLVEEPTRQQYLKDWKSRLQNIFSEEPLSFPKLSDFDHKSLMFHDESVKNGVSSIGHRNNP